MRTRTFLSLAAFAACIPIAQASAQVSLSVRLGPERSVSVYSTEVHGDWRTNYKQWQPRTLYVVDGHYYDKSTRGARAVVVYHHNNEYFLPPAEKAWEGKDKRYNLKHKPQQEDYDRSNGRGRGRGNDSP